MNILDRIRGYAIEPMQSEGRRKDHECHVFEDVHDLSSYLSRNGKRNLFILAKDASPSESNQAAKLCWLSDSIAVLVRVAIENEYHFDIRLIEFHWHVWSEAERLTFDAYADRMNEEDMGEWQMKGLPQSAESDIGDYVYPQLPNDGRMSKSDLFDFAAQRLIRLVEACQYQLILNEENLENWSEWEIKCHKNLEYFLKAASFFESQDDNTKNRIVRSLVEKGPSYELNVIRTQACSEDYAARVLGEHMFHAGFVDDANVEYFPLFSSAS